MRHLTQGSPSSSFLEFRFRPIFAAICNVCLTSAPVLAVLRQSQSQHRRQLRGRSEIYCLEIAAVRPRSKNLCILPVAVFGRSSTNEIQLGVLKWARWSRANRMSSASEGVPPGRDTTNARAASPHFGCGIPTIETSCTASWRSNTLSTSTDEMFSDRR